MGRDAPLASGFPGSATGSGLGEARLAGDRAAPHGGDCVDGVPAALPLPPCHGKRRLAFNFPAGAAMAAVPPVLLCEAARTTPTAWQSVVAAVLDIGDTVKIAPRVFGAVLWEHATGLPYLTAKSDLDLLWSVSDERAAVLLVEQLLKLETEGPVRLDGELELPDGAGVNWRELAHNSDQRGQVLVKTMDGVEVRTKAALFRIPVSLS
jgi:phosphoribosyl-dephospho-CoA transferase